MEATTKVLNLKQEALKSGAIWGAVNIVIFLVTWYAMPSLMSTYWYSGLTLIIGILLAVFFCLDLRKKAGGYWSFSEALWPIVGMFLMNMTLVFLFTIAFAKLIDKSYSEKMTQYAVENTVKMLNSMGADDGLVQKTMEETKERMEKQFNPGFKEATVNYGLAAVMYFIFALVFALIFKRNNPNPWAEQQNESVQE